MATMNLDGRGKPFIQFRDASGDRRMIRLGKLSQTQAAVVSRHVGRLNTAQLTGDDPPLSTLQFLAEASGYVRDKLEKAGLLKRDDDRATLGNFITKQRSRTDLKQTTLFARESTYKSLIEFFGEDTPLNKISRGDAREWRASAAKGRAENTVRKFTATAKALFNAAIEFELIAANPFVGLASTTAKIKGREFFVTQTMAKKVLAACPTVEWRLIFALARYGGLRCPSELQALKWDDVLDDRFIVHCTKTEHHLGHETRVVPRFPELDQLFADAFNEATEGAVYVFPRLQGFKAGSIVSMNLRTQMTDIVYRAGLNPWPKLFHNLRATRATELMEQFPSHVVTAWLGHSEAIAQKHYLQVTDSHYEKAAGGGAEGLKSDTVFAAELSCKELNGVTSKS